MFDKLFASFSHNHGKVKGGSKADLRFQAGQLQNEGLVDHLQEEE